jgi:hypothetical protein
MAAVAARCRVPARHGFRNAVVDEGVDEHLAVHIGPSRKAEQVQHRGGHVQDRGAMNRRAALHTRCAHAKDAEGPVLDRGTRGFGGM